MKQTAALPFSSRLREETRRAHSMAEKAEFVRGFLRGVIDEKNYRQLLVNYHHVYQTMEVAIRRHVDLPAIARVDFPSLYREQALELDLIHFAGTNWQKSLRPSRAARRYAKRIEQISDEQPELLVAHIYTRYLGDLSGGQILRGILCRALSVTPGQGTAFYDFAEISDPKAFKVLFRSRLDSLPLDEAMHKAIIQEANLVFRLNIEVFEELKGSALGSLAMMLCNAFSFHPHAA